MKIGIDPGHGGRDPGAVAGDLKEKDITLAVGLKLERFLQQAGLKTVMSRRDDREVSLLARASLFNRERVALIISLHVNSFVDPAPAYVCTFILAPGGRAGKAARLIQAELVAATGWPDGGVRIANFYLLRRTEAPAVLVEMGFLSNPAQASCLKGEDFREGLAKAIFSGVKRHLLHIEM